MNSGSSSVKASILERGTERELLEALIERIGDEEAHLSLSHEGQKIERALPRADHEAAMQALVEELRKLDLLEDLSAVGHRVVHGGERFSSPVRIDEEVRAVIRELARLAPLHNPANAIGIDAAERALPELPHVAVFDTAFHQSLPRAAYLYAIPFELYETHGLRRYGFHGCSHEFVSLEAARRLGRADLNLVTVHLGNGCSAAAVSGGRSVDTTMGLTPLEGLVMGTRSGDIDPGMLPLLCELTGRDLEGVMRLLNRESGLLGVSGLSNDMRELLEARASGHERAKLAIDVFCHRLARGIMGLTAALPRLDAIIFTGGIGENSPDIRAETLARLRVLGLELDAPANLEHGRHTHGRITTKRAPTALVIPTNEELMIAQHTLETLSRSEV